MSATTFDLGFKSKKGVFPNKRPETHLQIIN